MRRYVLALFLFGRVLAAQEAPAPIQPAPPELIVTYRCPPPRRAAFRQYMTELGIQRFDRWKKDGILSDYRFLFNWYVDVDTWDAMAVLSFPSYASLARWKDVEKASPGGLARDALDMAWPLNSYSVDLVAAETADPSNDHSRSVFFVVPYDAADFRDLADAWVVPRAKGSFREGVLASYSAYVNRYPGGKRWQGMVLLEYRDIDAFSRRDEVDAKVRARLRSDPAWKTAEAKRKSAAEREAVIADAVVMH